MYLRALAHSRTGDKGNTSNISVIAYRAEDWPLIEREVTVDRVAALLGPEIAGKITRYTLPQLQALNFVLKGALRGGVTRSLALDAHGKCLGSALLEMEIEPDSRAIPERDLGTLATGRSRQRKNRAGRER